MAKRLRKARLFGVFIGLVIIIVLLIILLSNDKQNEPIKIGAILSLSGPAAYWGEAIQEGMEIAREELLEEGIVIEIIYEDSEADSTKSVSAFNKLKEINEVDVMVAALSSVSIPLAPLADSNEIPLITTITSVEGITNKSDYVFRFYSDNRQYVDPHFDNWNAEKYDSIAILHLNAEYGYNIAKTVKDAARENNVEVVAEEQFNLGNSDFRTQLLKIKNKNPKALIFIGTLPPEIINAVKQIEELNIELDIFETSVLLSMDFIRESISKEIEGAHTTAFDFTLDESGDEFKEKFNSKYGKKPFFASALGYDIVNLIGQASNGKKMSGRELVDAIYAINSFEGSNGKIEIKDTGEINPRLRSVKIVN